MTAEDRTRITIRLLGELAARFGARDLELGVPAGAPVDEALRLLLCHAGVDAGTGGRLLVREPLVAFLNGRNIDLLTPSERRLREGDLLLVTRPIGGG